MADTARIADDESRVATAPKAPAALHLVRDDAHARHARDDERNVWRNAMIGYAIGFVVATCVIATAGTLGGLGFGPSLGFGMFIGIFGGGGFGFMTAASMSLAHDLDAGPLPRHAQGEIHGTATR